MILYIGVPQLPTSMQPAYHVPGTWYAFLMKYYLEVVLQAAVCAWSVSDGVNELVPEIRRKRAG